MNEATKTLNPWSVHTDTNVHDTRDCYELIAPKSYMEGSTEPPIVLRCFILETMK